METKTTRKISRSEINDIIGSYDYWYQHARFGFMLATKGKKKKLTTECKYWAKRILHIKTKEEVLYRSLPDLTGKRVIDIGCNSGLKSIEASSRGAAYVLGVERNVKAVCQAIDLMKIVKGIGRNLGDIEFKQLDDINDHLYLLDDKDVMLACCVLYHLGVNIEKFKERIRRSNISMLILQGNTNRSKKITDDMRLGGWGNVLCDVTGLINFGVDMGFKTKSVVAPNHQYPVVVALRK